MSKLTLAEGYAAPYTRYAAHYDRQGQGQWSVWLAAFTLQTLLPRHGRRPRTALDLACGTGTAALALAGAGLAVTGIDAAPAMLAVAREKARSLGVHARFLAGDMRDFQAPARFDLVLCCYDSLNYLTEPADLRRAFASARRALAAGGLLVCDANTARAYAGQTGWRLDLDEVAYA